MHTFKNYVLMFIKVILMPFFHKKKKKKKKKNMHEIDKRKSCTTLLKKFKMLPSIKPLDECPSIVWNETITVV